MNKRGAEWSLLQTMTILGGIMAAFLLVLIVYRCTGQERGERTFVAIDSAMLTDAMLAAPQNVQIAYPNEFISYINWYARIDNYSIFIFPGPPEPNSSSAYYEHFVRRGDISTREEDVKLSSFFLIKKDGEFWIGNTPILEVPKTEENKTIDEVT